MADVDPQLNQIPLKLLNDPELRDYFEQLERYRHDMWIRSGGGDDAIEIIIEEETSSTAESARLFAITNTLSKRISDIEVSNDTDALESKIARLNQKMNTLISDLLAAVNALTPDIEQESEKVVIMEQQLKELKLLNTRIEEAFETKIFEEDID